MLYAGTASLNSSKYSILNDIVKKFELRSKSAGNIFKLNIIPLVRLNIQLLNNGTSETLRNGVVVNSENVKIISNHVPKHLKPLNNEQFGYYLAGLIDGIGNFSYNAQQLVIVFSSSDAFLAYYLKGKLGFGNVRKVKDKNAYLLIISSFDNILYIINLINGKLRTEYRFNQVLDMLSSDNRYKDQNIKFTMDLSNDFYNHWLAGFSDAEASFQIKIIQCITINKPEIRLNLKIDQKSKKLLIKIKEYLGGNIGYRKSQDTYYYGSTNLGSARNVIQYFDKYHLQSRKHISYLKWRKVYRLIQDKEHLTEKGWAKILKIYQDLINFNKENTTT